MESLLIAFALSLAPQGLQLEGTVQGPDGPLSGATVYVASARPRRGIGVL